MYCWSSKFRLTLEAQLPWNKPWQKVNRIQPIWYETPHLGWFHKAEGGSNSILWVSLGRDFGVISACYFYLRFSDLQLLYASVRQAHLLQLNSPDSAVSPCHTRGRWALAPSLLGTAWERPVLWEWKALAGPREIRALHVTLVERIVILWKENPFLSRTKVNVWHQKSHGEVLRCGLLSEWDVLVSISRCQSCRTKGPSDGHLHMCQEDRQAGLENVGRSPQALQ